jgi:hypothetical protein
VTYSEKTKEVETSRNRNTLCRRFLENVLIEKYDATVSLAGKFLWPLLILMLSIIFYPDVSDLLGQLSRNLSRTSRINVAGIEIEVYADSFRSSDLEAYKLISKISREDLIVVLELGENRLQIDPKDYTPEYSLTFKNLIELGLISIQENAVSVQDSAPVIEIKLTDIGKRVYREIRTILINFIKDLPVESK